MKVRIPSPVYPVLAPILLERNIKLTIKRDDLIHPLISGNKWRKLKHPLAAALQAKKPGVLSLGGPYSNHLLALAAACHELGLASAALVRGHEQSTPTLAHCQALGMALHFVSRQDYRCRHDPDWLAQWQALYPDWLLLPEGGSAPEALTGVAELVAELPPGWDQIWTPVGSGGTLAGLVLGAQGQGEIVGVPTVKDAELPARIQGLLAARHCSHQNYRLLWGHEGPGFGKFSPAMGEAIRALEAELGVPLEPLYSGKLMLALWQAVESGELDGKQIVMLHTGGLQSLDGLRAQGRWPDA
ncbi:pyridoxal-phosphate dependent enzyme [Gallaecimonas kandeliae]|uniref:1-aminocyclopropane-1-carboxylate deaminase/D-cysteine desulfhydrase n=1 Tax=Gallaecimonas kandeliae TaxID=3029055 RepID=UPI002647902C|nr:pyridoxal-phosphate dependent enzyme [Gallaecimonas kandeliae]WKE66011.1 pyridoxal-phosphate dependent enzyme [Gallaecimonas kandeliae]